MTDNDLRAVVTRVRDGLREWWECPITPIGRQRIGESIDDLTAALADAPILSPGIAAAGEQEPQDVLCPKCESAMELVEGDYRCHGCGHEEPDPPPAPSTEERAAHSPEHILAYLKGNYMLLAPAAIKGLINQMGRWPDKVSEWLEDNEEASNESS